MPEDADPRIAGQLVEPRQILARADRGLLDHDDLERIVILGEQHLEQLGERRQAIVRPDDDRQPGLACIERSRLPVRRHQGRCYHDRGPAYS